MARDLTVSTRITGREAGRALLELLVERFPYHDRAQWQAAIAAGHLLLNGEPAEPEQQLSRGDLLAYRAAGYGEPEVPEQIEEIFAGPDLLLVGKPADVPLQRTGQIIANTFINQLRRHYHQKIHPLHRLDRETSGLLLCARSAEANRLYHSRREKILRGKFYLAVVQGCFPQQEVRIDQPLAPDAGSPIRCQMWPVATGKSCCSRIFRIAADEDLSLLLVEPLTGRRHQIRAHLAHLGYPLLGDKIYAHDGRYYLQRLQAPLTIDDFARLGARQHLLHAWTQVLQLPGEREPRLFFSRQLSEDFGTHLQRFADWQPRALKVLEDWISAA